MSFTKTIVHSRTKEKTWHGEVEVVDSTTYKLAPKPFRIYSRFELPNSYEMEDWETEDDSWIRSNGEFYNLNEFLTVGHLSGPNGGAQLAAGDFLIAAWKGEVYRVTIS